VDFAIALASDAEIGRATAAARDAIDVLSSGTSVRRAAPADATSFSIRESYRRGAVARTSVMSERVAAAAISSTR